MTPLLTPVQRATLKTAIQGSSDTNTLYVDGNLDGLAAALNALVVPQFVVWRTFVQQDEIQLNGFDWARVDNLSVGKARIWEWMFDNLSKAINPSKANVRAGIDATWVGTQADQAVAAAIYVHCKRDASRFEKFFASGTGSTVTPATMVIEGPVTPAELSGL